MLQRLRFTIKVWATALDVRDKLSQDIIQALRTNHLSNVATGTLANNLFSPKIVESSNELSESGAESLKVKRIVAEYKYITV